MKTQNSPGSPCTMEEAVGYPAIDCGSQRVIDHALVLKKDDYFFISNAHGDIAPAGSCSLGLFENDTRILSHYAVNCRGGTSSLLSVQSPHTYLGQIDLTITDEEFAGNRWDPKNCIHLRRELLLADHFLEQLTLTSYLSDPIPGYWVDLTVGCDFADIFEVRGWKRHRRGQFFAPEPSPASLRMAYQGLDGEVITSTVEFHEPPTEVSMRGARWQFDLLPDTVHRFEWKVYGNATAASRTMWSGVDFATALKRRDTDHAQWESECTRFTTSPPEFAGLLDRAIDDLNALHVRVGGRRIISAGIPWYSTIFGRDAIITSLQTLPLNPEIARETLRYLAQHQGRLEDPFTEEEPGKIMHELRRGEMARNREIPHVPFYGTIDATPLWLILLHETWLWTNDRQLILDLLPHAQRALDWIDHFGDKDGDGLVEYRGSATSKGLANQGWKDSGNGVPFPDGALPEPPIALVEVQGYVYDAFVRMAALYIAFGETERAEILAKKAVSLRENVVRQFWLEDMGTFALALDGGKQPLPTMTSNAGHLLWSGVPDARQAKFLADHLMGKDMYSKWGIRTLSAAHRVYNPMSYHNGSVWPHDNALIAMGLVRYGFGEAAATVLGGLHEAAGFDEFQRLPELFCGMTQTIGTHPVWYPVSCRPQAWAAGAFFMLLRAVLGIEADAPAKSLRLKNPLLPDFLHELTVFGMRIGNSTVSLQFQRVERRTAANLLTIDGDDLQVQIELSDRLR